MTTANTAHKLYRHPPIDEVVCEFGFPKKVPWDAKVSDRIYDRLRGSYPTRTTGLERVVTAETADHKRRVKFSDDELSVHVLGEYPGWDMFFDHIRHALRVFFETAEPKTVSQINLRYRNKIMIPAKDPVLGNYFTLGVSIPHGLPTRLISYVTGIRAVYEDDTKKVLSVSFTAIPPESGGKRGVEVVLDVMVSQVQMQDPADLEHLFAIVTDFRGRAADAFEKILTDHTRALFA